MGSLNSPDRNHAFRYQYDDMDCKMQAPYVCQYNPDFQGFHRIEDLTLDPTLDVVIGSMSLTTCLALCHATVGPTVVAVLKGTRCICSKGAVIKNRSKVKLSLLVNCLGTSSYKVPTFKLKNKVSGKLMTAGSASGDLVTEADESGQDNQIWYTMMN